MPLLLSELEKGLSSVASAPPASRVSCANEWAAAVEAFAAGVAPASTTVAAAKIVLEASLAAAFATTNAAPLMETAFAAFAVTVGGGMAGFVPTPPPAPIGLAAQFAVQPATHAAAATAVADLVDTWMRTGTATPSGGGAPVSWS